MIFRLLFFLILGYFIFYIYRQVKAVASAAKSGGAGTRFRSSEKDISSKAKIIEEKRLDD